MFKRKGDLYLKKTDLRNLQDGEDGRAKGGGRYSFN